MTTQSAVPPEALRFDIPSKPDWFDRELANCVELYKGLPMFQCVNGMKERAWMDSDTSFLKYRNTDLEVVPVVMTYFTRFDAKLKKHRRYSTRELAAQDQDPNLGTLIIEATAIDVRWVGRPCWIIEVFVDSSYLGTQAEWEAHRYDMMEDRHRTIRKIDLLGEYPKEGQYKYAFSLVDDSGQAVTPARSHIEEAKKLYYLAKNDTRTLQQRILDDQARIEKLDQQTKDRIVERFGQYSSLTMKKIRGAAIGKPIMRVKE
jgi:hypothetical protein